MAEVFLSYAREDTSRAKALAAALERAGRSVWWDRNIEGGTEYSVEIDKALKSAEAVIVLWSNHSVGSAWVRDEAAFGRDTSRLVPVRLDACEPPLGFRQYQTIDLSRWTGRDGPALRTLMSAVSAKVGPAASSSSEASPTQGRSRVRRLPIAALMVGLLLISALVAYFLLGSPKEGSTTIAIVPAPTGGDPAQSAAFARSLSVEIGAVQAGAFGAFELREASGKDSKKLDYVVHVAARPVGANESVDLSLLTPKDSQVLWTSHFEMPTPDKAHIRFQAAARLQAVLGCLADGGSHGRRSLDQSTLKLYLRACEKFADALPGLVDLDQQGLLRQVVTQAPRFAPAIAHLALGEASAGRKQSARELVAKAKALDPRLAKIYLAENYLVPRSKWRERQAPLTEGLRLNPDAAVLHDAMAFELSQVGLLNDAIASAGRAVELDPASPVFRSNYVQMLTFAGRVNEAETALRKAENTWPTSISLRDMRFAFDLRVGNPARALEMLHKDQGLAFYPHTKAKLIEPGIEPFLQARIHPTPENIEKAINAHRSRLRQVPGEFGPTTIALAIFGHIDEAFAVLAHPEAMKALPNFSNVLFRSYFKPFHRDPRFMPIVARIGLVRYWAESGTWPDFCLEPDLPYDCKSEATRLKASGMVR